MFSANGNGAGWVSVIDGVVTKATYNVWVGPPPAISQFLMVGPCFAYGYITSIVSVCPGEPITLYPEIPTGVGSITGYQVTSSGCAAQVSSLTGAISFTSPFTVRATFSIDFRYSNSCGWSSWQTIYGSVRDCAGGEDPFKK